MTNEIDHERMPTLPEAYRFIYSNPAETMTILRQIEGLPLEAETLSDGRFRELWKTGGGMVDKKGRAWIEVDLLPGLMRTILLKAIEVAKNEVRP